MSSMVGEGEMAGAPVCGASFEVTTDRAAAPVMDALAKACGLGRVSNDQDKRRVYVPTAAASPWTEDVNNIVDED